MQNWTLVTGATSGIGKAIAEQYADDGEAIFMVARSEDDLKELQKKFTKQGVACDYLVQDLSKPGAAQAVVKSATKGKNTIKRLINNAGYTVYGQVVDTDEQKLQDLLQVNAAAVTELAQLAAKHMKENGGGRILNVSSTAGFMPGPTMAVYHATKAYVMSFSIALREELINDNIYVSALCPGMIATGFQKRGHMGNAALVRNRSRMMTPETVAEIAREGLAVNKAVIVPGLSFKIMMFFTRFIPRTTLASIIKRAYRQA